MPGGLFLQRGYLETCMFIVHSVTYTYMFCNLVWFFIMQKIEKQMLAKHILNKKNQSNESTEGNLDFSKMILNFFQSLAQVSMHHKLQVLLMGETFDLLHANQNFLVNLWLHHLS